MQNLIFILTVLTAVLKTIQNVSKTIDGEEPSHLLKSLNNISKTTLSYSLNCRKKIRK